MPLKLWEKTLSREVAQIIIICAGHPVLASASNDGWPPIKTYLFGRIAILHKFQCRAI